MQDAAKSYKFKVVLLGEGAVGKSSLLLRYVQNNFSQKHLSTIQASFLSKKLKLDGNDIDLSIWDTAGQEKYHALGPIYYRGSNGVLLVYDICDQRSFEKVKMWVRELQLALGDSAQLMIIGNKLDLAIGRTVDRSTAEEFAESIKAMYSETSAKDNVGIAEAFEELCEKMIESSNQADENAPEAVRTMRRIQLVDDSEIDEGRRGKCCR